ncbi:MAG TPA: phosphate signaling complex protein PhoU [Acidobacteriota bacterium]|nr:phosphate signaling complex protein PhoU [Acidobacteriota bacterium]
MTHYEQRIENDLSQIHDNVATVAGTIQQALKNAVYALLTGDNDLAYSVVLGDLAVNRAIRDIDRRCHAFVAQHHPSAGHLRRISSVLRLEIELERIGDYLASIAREAVQLSETPPDSVRKNIDFLADQVGKVLQNAIESFLDDDPELARTTKNAAYEIERTYESTFTDLLNEGEKGTRPLRDLFALLIVFNRLARIADQSKNICEDTLFTVTGETKQPKVYKILFVDEKNDCATQIAEAIGHESFANSGKFDSAGWNPAENIDPALLGFMERRGHVPDSVVASSLMSTAHEISDYHVIISLGGNVLDHIAAAPFHTIFLSWDIAPGPADLESNNAEKELEDIYNELVRQISNLMIALRGENVD